ncbi:zinc finger protein 511-like [Dreissena polymorpha]|uniref:C2H2-type domain-containing protein n=1 Tax=Dreissena polymorpha TaxID=45954 RepID=A0A9D4BQF0_DREPO|nr:zinc finger protein 511-like [Dreissena polymorpha]KAH3704749.1 hypothetical protein DPMN_079810 [Dreissena polymorpha]
MADPESFEVKNEGLVWCWKCVKRCLQPGDVLFEEGDIFCQLASKYVPVDVRREITYSRVSEFQCCISKCTKVFDSIAKYESHYNSCHRNVCSNCSRTYPTSHLLDLHMLETHDIMFAMLAERQPMFQCLLETCGSKFQDAKLRRNHMIKLHQYPANYRYDQKKHRSPMKTGIKEEKASHTDETRTIVKVTDSNTSDQAISMEIDGTTAQSCLPNNTNQPQTRVFKYNVPKTLSFGHGISRGFLPGRIRGRGRGHKPRQKHWHNAGSEDMETAVDIEHVDMKALSEALS